MSRSLRILTRALSLAAILAASSAQAQTTVHEPWVRGTVAQQTTSAMYATLTSAKGARLVAASSPVARVVEIHEMRMDGDVMRMRQVEAIELPAGKPVALAPGGYHLMLIDLKQPMKTGDVVAVTLVVEDAQKKRETVEVSAKVQAVGSTPGHMH
jgi:hypothetical protein